MGVRVSPSIGFKRIIYFLWLYIQISEAILSTYPVKNLEFYVPDGEFKNFGKSIQNFIQRKNIKNISIGAEPPITFTSLLHIK